MTLRGRFIPERSVALFLDVDGTLLEIANSPDAVRVPAALRNTLQLAAQREDGALALISGRSIAALDQLFAPAIFAAAGQHGFERRDVHGRVSQMPIQAALLDRARNQLAVVAARHDGLLLEDKGMALALHYRAVPQLKTLAEQAAETASQSVQPEFRLRNGKCVIEIVPACCSKRTAIEIFMREPPFAGRTPVFVGDDVTDEDGFEAVNALGGYSIRVGATASTAARYRFESVSGVVSWLRERNTAVMRFLYS